MALPYVTANQAKNLQKQIDELKESSSSGGTQLYKHQLIINAFDDVQEPITAQVTLYNTDSTSLTNSECSLEDLLIVLQNAITTKCYNENISASYIVTISCWTTNSLAYPGALCGFYLDWESSNDHVEIYPDAEKEVVSVTDTVTSL